jgi:hypothetical protein
MLLLLSIFANRYFFVIILRGLDRVKNYPRELILPLVEVLENIMKHRRFIDESGGPQTIQCSFGSRRNS